MVWAETPLACWGNESPAPAGGQLLAGAVDRASEGRSQYDSLVEASPKLRAREGYSHP